MMDNFILYQRIYDIFRFVVIFLWKFIGLEDLVKVNVYFEMDE